MAYIGYDFKDNKLVDVTFNSETGAKIDEIHEAAKESGSIAFVHNDDDEQYIYAYGHKYNCKEYKVGDNKTFEVNGTKYTLNITGANISIDPYTKSKFVLKADPNNVENQSTAYFWGEPYKQTATVTPSNKLTYSSTQYDNDCVLTGIKLDDATSYLYGGQVTVASGTISDAVYIKDNIASTAIDLITGSGLETAKSITNEGTMEASGNTSTVANTAAIPARSFTLYWHEKGLDTVDTAKVSIDTSKATATATAKSIIYVSDSAQPTVTSNIVSGARAVNINNATTTAPKNTKVTFNADGVHYVMIPSVWSSDTGLDCTWSGYKDTSFVKKETVQVKLSANATTTVDYDVYEYTKSAMSGDWILFVR